MCAVRTDPTGTVRQGLDGPASAPVTDGVDRPRARRSLRVFLLGLIVMAILVVGAVPVAAEDDQDPDQPVPTEPDKPTQSERVVDAVMSHLGARYVWGSTGPRGFDCSGLVYRSFKEARLVGRIGGFNTAHGYYKRFKKLGRVTKHPKVGDLVVWNNGGHVGIYVGHGKAVSALLSGVKKHKVKALNIPFTAYLRVNLKRGDGDSTDPILASDKPRVRKARVRLPVRAKPTAESRKLRNVAKGTRMTVLRKRQGPQGKIWLKVKLGNGDKGWVKRSLTQPKG